MAGNIRRFPRPIAQAALTVIGLGLALAACSVEAPTPTPAWVMTGPTLEPSPTFMPRRPTTEPFDAVFIGQNDPTAAALPPGGALPPLPVGAIQADDRQSVTVTAADGALLEGDLYRSGAVPLPGVLLLAESRAQWGEFPAQLHASGYTVLTMDIRPGVPLADFTVMLQALNSGEADPARLGVIGAGPGADMALLGCAADLLCDAVVLLSPSPAPALLDAVPGFNPRPLFLTASQDDALSFGAVDALRGAAGGEVFYQPFERAGHGAAMLQNRPDLAGLIIQWLEQYLV